MGNKNQGTVQGQQQQKGGGGMFSGLFGSGNKQQPVQPQVAYAQQPQYVQQPQYAQQAQYVPQPQYAQQPQYVQQPQYAQQAQYAPRQPYPFQQPSYRPAFPSGPNLPRYPVSPPITLPTDRDPSSYYQNDAFLSSLTGWSSQDIERLRHEFLSYANQYGVIDREGFRKLYIASLLNMTWEAVERDAEAAFRNFDINQTGALDFNEYITACSRMTREVNHGAPIDSSYTY